MKTMMTTRRARDHSRRPASRSGVTAIALGMLALLCFAAIPARAETILITLAGAPVANGPNWDWTYNVELTGFSSLNSGDTSDPIGPPIFTDVWFPDFGEIYDFAGMVGTPTFAANTGGTGLVNADFSVTTPNQDAAAETAIFGGGSGEVLDDQAGPNANNIKLSFVRAAAYTNNAATTILLGQLTATSTFRFSTTDTYIGTDTKPNGMSGKNSSTVEVPVVPTPQTVWGGLALFSVMGLVKARRLVGV
jgi:hypothetical protein